MSASVPGSEIERRKAETRPSSPRSSRISSTTARYSRSRLRVLPSTGTASGALRPRRTVGRRAASGRRRRRRGAGPAGQTARPPPGRRTRSVISATVPTAANSFSWRGTSSTRSSSPASMASVSDMPGKTTTSSSGTRRRRLIKSSLSVVAYEEISRGYHEDRGGSHQISVDTTEIIAARRGVAGRPVPSVQVCDHAAMPAHRIRPDDPAHDVLAAEEFACPLRTPSSTASRPMTSWRPRSSRCPLLTRPAPRTGRLPDDPTGIAEPHDVLAAEEFAMPAPRAPASASERGARAPARVGVRRARRRVLRCRRRAGRRRPRG